MPVGSATIDCMAEAAKATGKRAAVLATYPENMPEALAEQIGDKGLVPLNGMQAGMEGLRRCLARQRALHASCPLPRVQPNSNRMKHLQKQI